jgi:hypothetical protein
MQAGFGHRTGTGLVLAAQDLKPAGPHFALAEVTVLLVLSG